MPIKWLTRISVIITLAPLLLGAGPLSQLCKNGLQNHPKIRTKLYQQESKSYAYKQGVDQYLPQITMRGQAGEKKYVYKLPDGDSWHHESFATYTVSIQQALYRPVLLRQIDDARQREILAHYQTEDEKANLVTQIALTSIELLRLHQIRQLAEKKIQLYREAYYQIQEKFKSKFTDISAVAQARARLRQSQADYARYNQMYRYIFNNLKFLSNVKQMPNTLIRKKFDAQAVARHYRIGDLNKHLKAIQHNTRIRVYRKYKDIAKNMIEMRKAEHYPSLSIRASYNDGDFGDPTDSRKNSRIALQFNVPIFQGGYVTDRIHEAETLYLAAVQDLENAKLESRSSMEKNWEQIQTGLQTVKALREAEKASEVYYKTSLNAYKNGLQSLTDTYQANIDYYDTKVKRINAEADLLSAIIKLYYTAGVATPRQIALFEQRYLH